MILRAAIEPDDGTERQHIEVTVETFAQGKVELDKRTPDGWRRVWIIVGPMSAASDTLNP